MGRHCRVCATERLTVATVLAHCLFSDAIATGFNLTDGHVEITVPFVTPGCDYQINLFGDSGNFGPTFIIASDGD